MMDVYANLRLISALVALIITGCFSIGPANDASFPEVLKKSFPTNTETALIYGRATWYSRTNGFDFLYRGRQRGDPENGLVVLFETNLQLLRWNAKQERYDSVHRLDYADLIDVRLDEEGVACVIVMEFSKGEFNTFSFMSSGGMTYNRGRTMNGFEILKERLQPRENRSGS